MKMEKVEKVVANLHDKSEYVIHIRNLKQALNHELVLNKVRRIIKFKQRVLLKSYIDMNIDLRKKAKNDFEKKKFKLMNNALFGKTMENARKYIDIKLVTTEIRRNCQNQIGVRTKLSYYKVFHRISINNRNEITPVLINKPAYLGLSILELSKVLMYEIRYDYVKPKDGEKQYCVIWIHAVLWFT